MAKKKTIKKAVVKKPVKKRVKVDKTPKEGEYLGIPYESFCELSCLYFAEELIKAGYATAVTRPPSYSLCDPVYNNYAEQLKKGSKQVTQAISQGVTYTPDYRIIFNSKAIGKFIWVLGSNQKYNKNLLVAQAVPYMGLPSEYEATKKEDMQYVVTIEVKPDFSRNSSTPKSVQSMKWLYQRKGIFVNLFRPNRIFEGLFVPNKYLLTERGTPRLLKFKKRNLQEYLKLTQ